MGSLYSTVGRSMGCRTRMPNHILAMTLNSYVILDKLLNLFAPQSSYLLNGPDNDSFCLTVCFRELSKFVYVKKLGQGIFLVSSQ